jgi:2,3-bisphosphoglycerate-independent phosphoglycerate mutase
MINPDGSPNTAHTTNDVPIYLLANNKDIKLHNGKLADIAPTVLQLMHLEQPIEMTGVSLLDI